MTAFEEEKNFVSLKHRIFRSGSQRLLFVSEFEKMTLGKEISHQ